MTRISTSSIKLVWAAIVMLLLPLFSSISASEIKDNQRLARSIEDEFDESLEARLDSNSTLADYLAFAALNNPGLKADFYAWKAGLEKIPQMKSLPEPMLTFGYFIENVETRVGPQEWRLGIRQTLPWFGTLAAKKGIAFETANVAYRKYQSAKLKLFFDVKSAYYDYYLLGREIQLASDHIKLLGYWESVALTKYKSSLSQHPDVIKTQLEQGRLEDQLAGLENMKKSVNARLNAALNLSISKALPSPEYIPDQSLEISPDSLRLLMLTGNPGLKSLDHLIASERESISLANRAYLPDFSFGIEYTQTGEAMNPGLIDSGKDPLFISAGINLPLWFGKNGAGRNEAKARYKSAEFKKLQMENQLNAFFEKTLVEYTDAVREVGLYRDGLIPKAEQLLNATFTAYQTGKTDYLNLIDAQRMLLQFQLNLEKALVAKAKKIAELELLVGVEITKTEIKN